MTTRKVSRVTRSKAVIEGAGVHLKRSFGYDDIPDFDPFLMLDNFSSNDPRDYLAGFPWHPHRGIETVTYLIDGEVDHGDSLGNSGIIGPGDAQWMTAGRGILHQEMPMATHGGRMKGIQIWVNLPATEKMCTPRYQDIRAVDIPALTLASGVTVRVVLGEIEGIRGPVRDIATDPEMFEIQMPAHAQFSHRIKHGYTCIAYCLGGSVHSDGDETNPESLVNELSSALYGRTGDRVLLATGESASTIIILTGRPLGEPIAWGGPIVMNTDDELRRAFAELDAGTFIRKSD